MLSSALALESIIFSKKDLVSVGLKIDSIFQRNRAGNLLILAQFNHDHKLQFGIHQVVHGTHYQSRCIFEEVAPKFNSASYSHFVHQYTKYSPSEANNLFQSMLQKNKNNIYTHTIKFIENSLHIEETTKNDFLQFLFTLQKYYHQCEALCNLKLSKEKFDHFILISLAESRFDYIFWILDFSTEQEWKSFMKPNQQKLLKTPGKKRKRKTKKKPCNSIIQEN